jgi:putative Ca2+/H+ antiporter (TMEM165/GDT1 family)
VEALLTTFIAAALAEFGDKTQMLVVALAARYGKTGPILAGVAIAALLNAVIAAVGGSLINGMITLRAISLMVGLALLFAGVGGLLRQKQPDVSGWNTGAFVTAFGAFFLYELGDKTQFLTGALAAQFDSIVLASAGAAGGVLAANVPAAVLGPRLPKLWPIKGLRTGASILFLLAGFFVAVSALRLV